MKNLFYSVALLFAVSSISAQSLWQEGTYNGGQGTYPAGQLGTMDYWPSTPNGQVLGWYGSVSGATGSTILIEEDAGRNSGTNPSDKAVKITVDWKSGASYHITFRSLSYSGSELAKADFNPFAIIPGSTFYYSFWAKTDAGGYPANKLFPTITKDVMTYTAKQIKNSENGNITLTTDWQLYVFSVTNSPAPKDNFPAILFTFQASGVVYIDDVEISTQMPVVMPTGISETKNNAAPLNIISGDGGITFSSLGGLVSVYDITGALVAQKSVAEGINNIVLANKGIYIVKLSKDGKDTVVKAPVK